MTRKEELEDLCRQLVKGGKALYAHTDGEYIYFTPLKPLPVIHFTVPARVSNVSFDEVVGKGWS